MKRTLGIGLILAILVPAPMTAQSQTKETVQKWSCIWVGKDSKAPAIADIVEEFNKANAGKIRVEIEPQPDCSAYEQKLRTTLAAGLSPGDIFNFGLNATTKEFYNSKFLMEFSKDLTGDWRASFDKGAIAQSLVDKELKSLPFETAVLPPGTTPT